MQQPDPATPLEALASARNLLMAADRMCADLRLPDPELDDALTRIRWAHGLLWDLSRRYAAGRAADSAARASTHDVRAMEAGAMAEARRAVQEERARQAAASEEGSDG